MWEINISDQLLNISVFLIYGVGSCLFYDVIRAFRKTGSDSFSEVMTGDILFSAVNGIAFFLLSLAATFGEIRGYALLSALSGFILCRLTLSRLLLPIFIFLIKFFRKTIGFISVKIASFCGQISLFAASSLYKMHNVCLYIKKCLKNCGKVLYNNTNLSKGREKSDER